MKTKNLVAPLFVMLLWGSLFPLVKLGMNTYGVKSLGDILLFAGLRFAVCGAVICLFALARDRSSYKEVKHSIWPTLLSGLFAVVLHYGFTYSALTLCDSSKTALIKQVGALFYVCFSFVFFREDRPTWQKLLGAALGFLGIAAVNWNKTGFSFGLGEFLVVCASFCTVFSNVAGKNALKKVPPVTMTGVSQLFGGALLLAVGFALGGKVRISFEKSYIFVLICIASVISYCLWFGAVKKGELSKLFIIKFAEPVFACIFSALVIGENVLKIQYLVGFLLICFGILLSELSSGLEKTLKK